MKTMDKLFDGSNAHELGSATAEDALSSAEVPAAGGSPAPDMVDAIADKLLEDHMSLMAENEKLRGKADKLNEAMLMLAKLRDEKYYQKGSYSSDVQAEWDALLNSWFGEVRPCF
jgi:hypothetical protein